MFFSESLRFSSQRLVGAAFYPDLSASCRSESESNPLIQMSFQGARHQVVDDQEILILI